MIDPGFNVKTNQLGTGLGERLRVELGLIEHQVDIEEEIRGFTSQFRDHLRPECQVRHEVPVHDIKM
jgi:hypothetical protein